MPRRRRLYRGGWRRSGRCDASAQRAALRADRHKTGQRGGGVFTRRTRLTSAWALPKPLPVTSLPQREKAKSEKRPVRSPQKLPAVKKVTIVTPNGVFAAKIYLHCLQVVLTMSKSETRTLITK